MVRVRDGAELAARLWDGGRRTRRRVPPPFHIRNVKTYFTSFSSLTIPSESYSPKEKILVGGFWSKFVYFREHHRSPHHRPSRRPNLQPIAPSAQPHHTQNHHNPSPPPNKTSRLTTPPPRTYNGWSRIPPRKEIPHPYPYLLSLPTSRAASLTPRKSSPWLRSSLPVRHPRTTEPRTPEHPTDNGNRRDRLLRHQQLRRDACCQ